jgi:hypothetical protein
MEKSAEPSAAAPGATPAALHTHTRDFAHACDDLDEAIDLATRCGFRLHEADAHLGYARLHLATAPLPPTPPPCPPNPPRSQPTRRVSHLGAMKGPVLEGALILPVLDP